MNHKQPLEPEEPAPQTENRQQFGNWCASWMANIGKTVWLDW